MTGLAAAGDGSARAASGARLPRRRAARDAAPAGLGDGRGDDAGRGPLPPAEPGRRRRRIDTIRVRRLFG